MASFAAAHRSSASYFFPGQSSSSFHECDRKASISPSFALYERSPRPTAESDADTAAAAADVEAPTATPELAKSAARRLETVTARKRAVASASTFDGATPPHRPATAAARCVSLPRVPREPSQRRTRPRLARVAMRQMKILKPPQMFHGRNHAKRITGGP